MRFITGHHGRKWWNPEMLWSKVEKTETCWLWTHWLDISGYGIIRCNGKLLKAHRIAYELLIGKIPEDKQLDHLCRVRKCVNPSHLEPVACRENLMRGQGTAALNARKTLCKRGHQFDGVNVNGERTCSACVRERARIKQEMQLSNSRTVPPAVEPPVFEEGTYRF